MVPTLIESARRTDTPRVLGTAVVWFTIHAGVIAGAVFATLQVKGTDHTVKVDTTMVLLAPQQRPKAPEQQPAQLDVPLKGFQVVVVPPEIPADIPPVDLHEHFDPKDYSGAGVEGGLQDRPEPPRRVRSVHPAMGGDRAVQAGPVAGSSGARARPPAARLRRVSELNGSWRTRYVAAVTH